MRLYALRVAAHDHDTFIRTVDGYPSYSFDKRLKFSAQEVDHWRSEGHDVVEVDVTPDDFTRYCRETGAPRSYETLRNIASAKGAGKFK